MAGFSFQVYPPHPPAIDGNKVHTVNWHVLLLSCQLTCLRLPYIQGPTCQLVQQPQPCHSHTVLNARRHLVYRPIPSSNSGSILGSSCCISSQVAGSLALLAITLLPRLSDVVSLLAFLALYRPLWTAYILVHVRPRPSSIASLCLRGASTPPDQLEACLPPPASQPVSASKSHQTAAILRLATVAVPLSAGAHPTPRLLQAIPLRYVSSRPSAGILR